MRYDDHRFVGFTDHMNKNNTQINNASLDKLIAVMTFTSTDDSTKKFEEWNKWENIMNDDKIWKC